MTVFSKICGSESVLIIYKRILSQLKKGFKIFKDNLFTKKSSFVLKVKVGQISLRPILHMTFNPKPQAILTLKQS